MFLKPSSRLMLILMWMVVTTESGKSYSVSLQNIANVSYATKNLSPSASASMFSPRMDFDQWKPLIGRGDPLRNDPTYDYEPPVLERVRYWADESRIEREHYPERKSEVLMLGITSRKPSVSPQQPLLPLPPRRQRLPPPPSYEDLTYKISEYYPMTILVPPPPSPPGHKPSLFILSEEKIPSTYAHGKESVSTKIYPKTTTPVVAHHSSSYDIKEANLIYQSSTTIENWVNDHKQTNSVANSAVSSEYAGWGPTTPIDEIDTANDTFNSIFYDYKDLSKHAYSFYKPSSDSPSPVTSKPFLPTILPTFSSLTYTTPLTTQYDVDILKTTTSTESPSTELPTTYFKDEKIAVEQYEIQVDQSSHLPSSNNTEQTIEDMMGLMMSMPLGNGPERPQDNLYAHATNNLHVFREYQSEDATELENMQTMQPPPIKSTERTPISQDQSYDLPPHILSTLLHNSPVAHGLDPYLHMRFTTANFENSKSTTEAPAVPMYLIIQGHSKVKTYGSKPQTAEGNEMIRNETQKLNLTDEVKHLHPIKDKKLKKDNSEVKRKSRTYNLISLVDSGLGSIEIQEADVGIKYDVSDGSKVPVEIYRKGIVDTEINHNYLLKKKQIAKERKKRQISIKDLIPFDEDSLEEYVYNFLEERRNGTGISGLIAQAVTSDAAAAVDELENDDDDER